MTTYKDRITLLLDPETTKKVKKLQAYAMLNCKGMISFSVAADFLLNATEISQELKNEFVEFVNEK